MSSYYYFLLTLFSIAIWLIVVDPNVSHYINLLFKLVGVNYRKFVWILKYHPQNPIANFLMRRKYSQIAKELEEEFDKKQ